MQLNNFGLPFLIGLNGNSTIVLENISTTGIGISVSLSNTPPADMLAHNFAYIYLKLKNPLPGKYGVCSLFLGLSIRSRREADSRTVFGCKVVQRAVPEKGSKSFILFNVERFGVKELTVWCDDISRLGRGILPPPAQGIDLDFLLAEIFESSTTIGATGKL